MILIESIIKQAIEKDASDIHLINGLKPMLRVARALVEIKEMDPLDEATLYEIYDYIVKGNVEKNEEYMQKRRLDTSLVFENVRLRVNSSFADDVPIFTMRIIKDTLPAFEELGVPEIVRTMTRQPQGLLSLIHI